MIFYVILMDINSILIANYVLCNFYIKNTLVFYILIYLLKFQYFFIFYFVEADNVEPEIYLRSRFQELNLKIDAFCSLEYLGRCSNSLPTDFKELREKVAKHVQNSSVRAVRSPAIVFKLLKVNFILFTCSHYLFCNNKIFCFVLMLLSPPPHFLFFWSCPVACLMFSYLMIFVGYELNYSKTFLFIFHNYT